MAFMVTVQPDTSVESQSTNERAHGLLEYIINGPTGVLPRDKHVQRAKGAVGLGYQAEESYIVGREKVREFAKAVFATHPVHYSTEFAQKHNLRGIMAPPAFIGILGVLTQKRLTEGFVVGYDVSQIMQTDQQIEFHAPIYEGDDLSIDVIFDGFREIAGTDIIVTKNIVYNQFGERVISSWTTVVARVVEGENKEAEAAIKGVMISER